MSDWEVECPDCQSVARLLQSEDGYKLTVQAGGDKRVVDLDRRVDHYLCWHCNNRFLVCHVDGRIVSEDDFNLGLAMLDLGRVLYGK